MTRSIAITIKITVAYDTARIGGISITSSTDITRVEAGNKHLEETQKIAIVDDSEADSEINLNETQTFKLNIEE